MTNYPTCGEYSDPVTFTVNRDEFRVIMDCLEDIHMFLRGNPVLAHNLRNHPQKRRLGLVLEEGRSLLAPEYAKYNATYCESGRDCGMADVRERISQIYETMTRLNQQGEPEAQSALYDWF